MLSNCVAKTLLTLRSGLASDSKTDFFTEEAVWVIHTKYAISRINGCSRQVVATFFTQHAFIVLIEFAGLLNATAKKNVPIGLYTTSLILCYHPKDDTMPLCWMAFSEQTSKYLAYQSHDESRLVLSCRCHNCLLVSRCDGSSWTHRGNVINNGANFCQLPKALTECVPT